MREEQWNHCGLLRWRQGQQHRRLLPTLSAEQPVISMALRRHMKNFVKNYSDSEVKVREATSNDPWGPSSSLMLEISDLTYNTVSLLEIMNMIWHRMNDQGKNWRHVYKSLMLLDYLIKNGSKKVIQHCQEGLFNIQTLKDFHYIDEAGKDQGLRFQSGIGADSTGPHGRSGVGAGIEHPRERGEVGAYAVWDRLVTTESSYHPIYV
ncbi:unnamed protein product [Caretta caretta]